MNYHELPDDRYCDVRNTVVKTFENPQLARGENLPAVGNVVDVLDNPTVGYGYDLTRHDMDTIRAAFTTAFAGARTATAEEALARIEAWKDGRLSADDLCAWRPETPLFDDTSATRLLSSVLDGSYEAMLDAALAHAPGLAVPRSRERAALLSLVYNGGAGMIGPGLRGALASGNRAEAWWQIRYDSNGGSIAGLATRRCFEGDLFGIYDDPAAVGTEEAALTLAMDKAHASQMAAYDARFPHAVTDANTNDAAMVSLLPCGRVQTLAEALAPAQAVA